MKSVPLRPSNYASMHPFCTTYCNHKFAKSIGKCVFFVYSPFSEATFSIVCFIAWLRCEISTFFASHPASFCAKMLAALGTSKAKAHATHVAVAQHISKSIPFRYHSLQCKPSRFRPHAIAGFRLHASLRRSETVCRA